MWRFRFSFVPCSLLLLLVFLLSGGCSSTPQSCKNKDDCLDGQVCRKQICIQSSSKGCLRNSDCQGGRVCELTTGLCVECLQDKDCDLGRQCLGQRCQSGGADGGVEQAGLPESSAESLVCKTDADCPSDQKCDIVSGQCIPKQGSQCKTDNECAGDKYCVSGTCVPGRRNCQSNAECQGGFDCRKGFCYRSKCQSNDDCPAGEACDNLKQQCVPANAQDCSQTGCPPGQVCNPTTKQCETSTNCTQTGCASGETCNPSTGLCEPANKQDCTQSGCPSGQKCNPTTKRCEAAQSNCTADAGCIPPNGTCKNGTCMSCSQSGCPTNKWCNVSTGRCIDTPPKCTTNSDCTAPRGTCLNGGCLSCASQFLCPSGQACNQATGVCGKPPCQSDNDCSPPSGSCQTGVCQTCARDFTCPSGQQCENSTGRCRILPPPCTSNSQCSPPYGTCRSGKCESCRNFVCPSGEQCNTSTGLCYKAAQRCTRDSDCSAPTGTCRFGRCASCAAFSCPSGTTCNSTTGLCKGCASNSDCKAPNGWCRNSRCTTCRFYSCASSLKCNYTTGICEPKTCSSNGDCRAPKGACYQGKCQSCDGDFSCPSSQVCDKASGLCQPKPECTKHTDCRFNQLCLSQRCVVSECDLANPCSGGQRCINRRCVAAYKPCYSYTCALNDRCLTGPDNTNGCYARCGVGGTTCGSDQECLSVTLQSGEKDRFCFPKATLKSGARCTPALLSSRCSNGVCVKSSPTSSYGSCFERCTPGSSQGCKSTQECAELSPGKGLCLSKGFRSKGSSCGTLTSRCQAQFVCLPGSSGTFSGRCSARCTAVGSSGTSAGCASGESCITTPYSRSGGICAPQGKRLDGYTCKPFTTDMCVTGLVCDPNPLSVRGEGVCRKRCQSDSNCTRSTEACVKGVCMPKPTGREGASCRFGSSLSSYYCKQGLECYKDPSSSSSYGTCKKPCTSNASCSSTYPECFAGYCEKKGTRDENTSCSGYRCKAGLTCVKTSSFSSRCLKPCKRNSDCSSSYPECFAGFCLTAGKIEEDKYCSDSLTSRCKSPLRCAQPSSTSFSRRCVRSCRSDSDCTGVYKKCVKSKDGGMVCYK